MRTADGSAERLQALDILRGLALFGMILVHFHQKMRLEVSGLEDLIGWGVWVLVEQKAWAVFAFLFGAGFAILLRRLDARGTPVTAIYLRRLGMLAIFGVVAEVCFGFHILFEYACWGLVLLVVRAWSSRALLWSAALAASIRPITTEVIALHAYHERGTEAPALFVGEWAYALYDARRDRLLVARDPFEFEGDKLPVTISIGIAVLEADPLDLAASIKLADENLYKAKRAGRNRVVG